MTVPPAPPPQTLPQRLQVAGATAVVVSARFVPVPVVDNWVASFARRQIVQMLLRRHGRRCATGDLAAVYDDGSIWGLPWRMVKNVVMFPVKKLLRPLLPVLLARDLGLAVGRTIALAHVVDRQLRLGMFRDDDSKKERRAQAQRLRAAFDASFKGIDQRALRQAVGSVMARVRPSTAPQSESPEMQSLLSALDAAIDRHLADL